MSQRTAFEFEDKQKGKQYKKICAAYGRDNGFALHEERRIERYIYNLLVDLCVNDELIATIEC